MSWFGGKGKKEKKRKKGAKQSLLTRHGTPKRAPRGIGRWSGRKPHTRQIGFDNFVWVPGYKWRLDHQRIEAPKLQGLEVEEEYY